MSILVKGMKMPKECQTCPMSYCTFSGSKAVLACSELHKYVSDEDGCRDEECPLDEAEPKTCWYIVSKGTYSGSKNYKCTKCGDSFSWMQNEFYPWRFKYCRYCGAKVIGTVEEGAEHDSD